MTKQKGGWFFAEASNKNHYIKEGDKESLCGNICVMKISPGEEKDMKKPFCEECRKLLSIHPTPEKVEGWFFSESSNKSHYIKEGDFQPLCGILSLSRIDPVMVGKGSEPFCEKCRDMLTNASPKKYDFVLHIHMGRSVRSIALRKQDTKKVVNAIEKKIAKYYYARSAPVHRFEYDDKEFLLIIPKITLVELRKQDIRS